MFRPPSGQIGRIDANLAALRLIRRRKKIATVEDQRILARWSGWGAVPAVFDPHHKLGRRYGAAIADVLSPEELRWAEASTLNAHYTSPEVAEMMWDLLRRWGITEGSVLEPGCGVGVFMAGAPRGVNVVGVEMDPSTAAICAGLHPRHQVINERLEEFRGEGFVAAIGNVPFSEVHPFDPEHNPNRQLSLHNYALYRALLSLKPRGVLLSITSRHTLDSQADHQRRQLAKWGHFLGAVRLPNTAFTEQAGTAVTADIVAFQRRETPLSDEEAAELEEAWLESVPQVCADGDFHMNGWFVENPDLVCGTVRLGGMWGARDVRVVLDETSSLVEVVGTAIGEAGTANLPLGVPPADATEAPGEDPVLDWSPPPWYREGSVFAPGRGFVRITRNKPVTFHPRIPGNQNPQLVKTRLRALCHLRDAARTLLAAEQAGYGDDHLDRLRSRLDAAYRSARRAYGGKPLTRLTPNGNRRRAHLGEFRTDPDCGLVLGLEDISRSGKVTRAPIFTRRTVHPDVAPQMVNTVEDAVKASVGRTGRIDLNLMKQITEFDWDETDLAGLAFYDPQGGEWVPSVRYLSGNVRAKLNTVEQANDPRLEPNREALLAILPKPLESGDIHAGCGTPLLKPDEVQEFIEATLPDSRGNIAVVYTDAAGWTITGDLYHGAKERQDWGTARRTPLEIVAAAWAGRKIEVKDTVYDDDGNRRQVLNEVETAAASEKTEKWNNRLAEWMWDEDPTRCHQLVERYNDMFNAWVPPRYPADWIGRPPGLATGIEPYEHQAVAAAHIVDVGDFLLGHSVGAGKTMTMAIAAQESKRLGLIRKAAFVVPNHLVTDFAVEYQRVFPNARLLMPDEGRTPGPEEREEFVARCAWGDWDGIILSHSLFTMLKLRPETRAQYLHEELLDWRGALQSYRAQTDEHGGRDRLTVRRMQKAIEQREAQLQELIETQYVNREPAYWEDLGVDYLFVDEAHEFKNLSIPSMNRDLAFRGSGKATGLDMKLRWMRSHYDRSHGVVTVATGTPIANKLIELAVMQRYVMPDMLAQSGLFRFDDWVAQFGQRKGASELTAAGRGYKWRERIARYTNMPELFTMLAVRADIRSAEQLGLDRPSLVGAEPNIHTAPPTPHLNSFMDSLDDRQQNLEQPDNMLAVCTDAQKASLHLGLVGLPQDNPSKVLQCAEEVAGLYHRYADVEYRSEDPNAQPGALQVVFCDKGVPDGASTVPIYDILASHMTKAGVPREKIRFIHDYKTPAAKSALNKRCRNGEVAVLIGSTAKMGTGMNIQDRMIALHHLDYPWRPADIEQREGRILRPKNQNPQVFINYYLTEGSADAFSLQTIQRKQVLIDQFRSGNCDRIIEDIDTGSDAAVFGAIKALATGDPRSVRLNELNTEITQLTTRHQARVVQQQRLRRHIQNWERAIPKTEQRIRMLTELAEDPGDLEHITLPEWQNTPDEADYWKTMARHGPNHWLWRGMAVTEHRMWSRNRRRLGRLGNIDIHLARRPYNRRSAMFAIELGDPNTGLGFVISRKDWSRHFHNPHTKKPVQMDKRIGHALGRIPDLIAAAQKKLEEINSELPKLRDAISPVDRTDLDLLEAERAALEEDITNNPIERILPQEDLPDRHISL